MLKFKFLLFLLLFASATAVVKAQNNADMPDGRFNQPPPVLRELNLTEPQIRQIRVINRISREKMCEANFRLIESRKSLNEAIYADNADEATVLARLREFQAAQAEVTGIKLRTEFEIRKVLTPEQLARFRQMRQNFENFRENAPNLRRGRPRDIKNSPPQNRKKSL
jgi:Spy/CpxP family protein refolding chaperone